MPDISFSQGLQPDLGLKQTTELSPRLLQSLKILEMPVFSLETRIRDELRDNPVIEADESYSSADPEPPAPENDPHSLEDLNRSDFQEGLENMLGNGDDPWDWNDPELPRGGEDTFETDERRKYLIDSIESYGPSLYEDLLRQLDSASAPEEVRRTGGLILSHIFENTEDENAAVLGYLKTPDADIAQEARCSLETARQARELVMTLDPPGIGCRDGREYLLLQLRARGLENSRIYELVRDHADELGVRHPEKNAAVLGITAEELEEILDELKKLKPYPTFGVTAGSEQARFVVPDVEIVPDGDDYKAVLLHDSMPRFHISKKYLEMLEDPAVSPEDKKYIRDKVLRARNLQEDLESRGKTIRRVADLIAKNQHDFFRSGRGALRPMTRKELADKLDLHETTVGRAIRDKYIRTPAGLFPFSTFFSGGFASESGEDIAPDAVKKLIGDAIAAEDPNHPLSDGKIEKILLGKGLKVARRTIAKYREEMDIPSSFDRRKELM